VVASLVGVLIERFGDRSMFVAYVPLLVGTAVVTMTIARRGEIRSVTVVRDARAFLAAPRVAIFLTGSFLVWTSLNGTNSFYSIQVVALGGGTTLVGLAWAIGALVEVPIMFSFPRLAARFGTERLLVLGAIAIVLRAALAALARDPVMLVAIAPIEGLAFACTYVGRARHDRRIRARRRGRRRDHDLGAVRRLRGGQPRGDGGGGVRRPAGTFSGARRLTAGNPDRYDPGSYAMRSLRARVRALCDRRRAACMTTTCCRDTYESGSSLARCAGHRRPPLVSAPEWRDRRGRYEAGSYLTGFFG